MCKSDAAGALAQAIEALAAQRTYFSPHVLEVMLGSLDGPRARSPLEEFTARKLQLAQLMAEGRSNKQIALDLNYSEDGRVPSRSGDGQVELQQRRGLHELRVQAQSNRG